MHQYNENVSCELLTPCEVKNPCFV